MKTIFTTSELTSIGFSILANEAIFKKNERKFIVISDNMIFLNQIDISGNKTSTVYLTETSFEDLKSLVRMF